MPAQATAVSPQALIDAAKAPMTAYNDKNWDRAKSSITPDFVYDEVGTARKVKGRDPVIELWQGWAEAFPDSKCTFDRTFTSGDTVLFELTWRGTHQGALQSPKGSIAPTGKRIEIRAVAVLEISGDKAREQRHYFDMATLLGQLGVNA